MHTDCIHSNNAYDEFKQKAGEFRDVFAVLLAVSKPGLAPDGRGVFLQILQGRGCLSRF
jgi:hypothetical protein